MLGTIWPVIGLYLLRRFMRRDDCRVCKGKDLVKVLDLGKIPLANAFLSKEELKNPELTSPLELYFCRGCSFVQLSEVTDPKTLFWDYSYLSSTSPVLVKHFENLAGEVCSRFNLKPGSLVVDIGSNDGILLRPFKSKGMRVLGIEPASSISKKANDEDIETLPLYFTNDVAKKIVSEYGKAKVVTATSMFTHIDDLDDFIEGVKTLLTDDGVFMVECHYLGDIIKNTYFDTIYHEHLSYFSVGTITALFNRLGLNIFDVQRTDTHGGSLRVFASKKKINKGVSELGIKEQGLGLSRLSTYTDFAEKVFAAKNEIKDTVSSIVFQGKTVAGYGASAKSTTLLNYCGIDKEFIEFMVDDNKWKQGKFTPGTHIPIVSFEHLEKNMPDCLIIFAWNYANSIIEKLRTAGYSGRFMTLLPEPKVIL